MTLTRLLIAASALSLIAAVPAEAKSRKHYKARKIVYVAPAPVSEHEAARQRALLLYGGCVSDEGYGRYSPCGIGSSRFGR